MDKTIFSKAITIVPDSWKLRLTTMVSPRTYEYQGANIQIIVYQDSALPSCLEIIDRKGGVLFSGTLNMGVESMGALLKIVPEEQAVDIKMPGEDEMHNHHDSKDSIASTFGPRWNGG